MLNFIIKTIVGTIVGTITYMAISMGGIVLFYDKFVNWVMKKTIAAMNVDDDDSEFDVDEMLNNLFI